jgi:hypothetical protein
MSVVSRRVHVVLMFKREVRGGYHIRHVCFVALKGGEIVVEDL